MSTSWSSRPVDREAVAAAVRSQAARPTPGTGDIERYCGEQNVDTSHREIVGPLLPASGASGIVTVGGAEVATWGDPDAVEMCFSATKSVVSAVAGLAYDDGLLDPAAPVAGGAHPALDDAAARGVTWEALLHQTSGWEGELWGKPTSADAQSTSEKGWAYNDVRVNLLCLALTVLWGRPLGALLYERLLASSSWSWHGYAGAAVDGMPVVSGGAHWGGGLWMSARDLARFGRPYLEDRLLGRDWIERSWAPCAENPDYGYLWWLNDGGRVAPGAPTTGRCARGNGGRHLLWVDPARDLVIASHWGENPWRLVREVSRAVPA